MRFGIVIGLIVIASCVAVAPVHAQQDCADDEQLVDGVCYPADTDTPSDDDDATSDEETYDDYVRQLVEEEFAKSPIDATESQKERVATVVISASTTATSRQKLRDRVRDNVDYIVDQTTSDEDDTSDTETDDSDGYTVTVASGDDGDSYVTQSWSENEIENFQTNATAAVNTPQSPDPLTVTDAYFHEEKEVVLLVIESDQESTVSLTDSTDSVFLGYDGEPDYASGVNIDKGTNYILFDASLRGGYQVTTIASAGPTDSPKDDDLAYVANRDEALNFARDTTWWLTYNFGGSIGLGTVSTGVLYTIYRKLKDRQVFGLVDRDFDPATSGKTRGDYNE